MPNQTAALLNAIDADKATLDAARPLPQHTIASLREKLLLEWTYHSNAIEGNTLTLRETKVVLGGITVGAKSLREHFEATNHRDAIVYVESIVSNAEALSEWQIRNIHSLVLKGIDVEEAGRYRRENIVIAGASTTPPDFMHLAVAMAALIDWHEQAGGMHPVERAAELHTRFVKIHPFVDGNVQTGRLLLNFELMKAGYPPAIIRKEDRLAYTTRSTKPALVVTTATSCAWSPNRCSARSIRISTCSGCGMRQHRNRNLMAMRIELYGFSMKATGPQLNNPIVLITPCDFYSGLSVVVHEALDTKAIRSFEYVCMRGYRTEHDVRREIARLRFASVFYINSDFTISRSIAELPSDVKQLAVHPVIPAPEIPEGVVLFRNHLSIKIDRITFLDERKERRANPILDHLVMLFLYVSLNFVFKVSVHGLFGPVVSSCFYRRQARVRERTACKREQRYSYSFRRFQGTPPQATSEKNHRM